MTRWGAPAIKDHRLLEDLLGLLADALSKLALGRRRKKSEKKLSAMMMMRSFFVAVAAAASPMRVAWHGPFLSGGGYCSEATTFVLALEELEDVDLTIAQHGDAYSTSYVEGQMGTPGFEKLEMMLSRRQNLDVVICHSEPGAWHVLEGPKWQSSRCPPKKAKIVVGRTMFETDRLPKGWPNRLNAVDEVWVPTEFHRDIFHRAGVQSVYVIGEPVDVEQFTPDGPMFSSSSEFLTTLSSCYRCLNGNQGRDGIFY